MRALVVVENPQNWPLQLPQAEIVEARAYLTDASYQNSRRVTVYNFCRSYQYQTVGYYVSLLAAARGHRPLPSVETLGDLKLSPVIRLVSEQLEAVLKKAFREDEGDEVVLRFYLGRHPDDKYKALASAIFHHFPIPLLKVRFRRREQLWHLDAMRPLAAGEVPHEHHEFLVEQLSRFFANPRRPQRRKESALYSIAILVNPTEEDPPSDRKALEKFQRAARELKMEAILIEPSDYPHLAEFDALFIRETTSVNHHTYRFSRRAVAEGMPVIDDPESILRCCNKAFQAELFEQHKIPCPPTLLVGRDTPMEKLEKLGLPCVVKVPDSSFSRGVTRAESLDELKVALEKIFETSELAVVQTFTPSGFDWRIGVLDRQPLYACRYTMAAGHWQIYKELPNGQLVPGKVETVPVEEAPEAVVQTALAAANLIGDGLYGVDVKEVDGRPLVIEINDNPSLEAGDEDMYLKGELYLRIMRSFWERLERKRRELNL